MVENPQACYAHDLLNLRRRCVSVRSDTHHCHVLRCLLWSNTLLQYILLLISGSLHWPIPSTPCMHGSAMTWDLELRLLMIHLLDGTFKTWICGWNAFQVRMSSQTNRWPCNHCGGTTHYPINCPFHSSPSRDAGGPQPAAANHLVSRSLTTFFCFSLWWQKKGSGDLTIEFACDEIPRFWRALIAGDKPKSGANDLWGYASYWTSGQLPLPNFWTSGLGLIPKHDGGWQIIYHLSAPFAQSINDFIDAHA